MVQTSWNLSPVLMRKSSGPEVVDRSGVNTVLQTTTTTTTTKLQKAPEQQAKLQEISKRMRRLGNSQGTAPFGPPPRSPPPPFGDTAQRVKVVGETTAETMSLLSASIETICADGGGNNNNNKLTTTTTAALHGGTKQVVSGDLCGFQYHILAVDDSHIDQMVIEKLLRVSSYRVTTVNSALRALEVLGLSDNSASSFKKVDIDLIMTDYCMPEMSGYDLLKRVKAKTSTMKEIPVVVMSSENDSNRIKRCLAEGAEEFIIKPVQMADVKRLQGHMKPPSPTSSSETTEESSSSSTCGKRKAVDCSELHEVSSPERRNSRQQ